MPLSYAELDPRVVEMPRSEFLSPDMSILNNGRRAAPVMTGELFGPVWAIIQDVAEVTSTAPDYAAIAYLAAAASLVGGKRRVRPHGDWTEPCIVWTGALGEPSSRKSSPLEMMTKPLWNIAKDAREGFDESMKVWQADAERAKVERARWQDDVKAAMKDGLRTPPLPDLAVEPPRPPERRTIISDVTPEAAAYVLADNPQGVLCYNDELQQWFDGFDRYNAGGRPFWLAAFGGRAHSVTRKGSGSIHIEFNGISVLGSIQPDKLVPLLAGANDGLIPRLLWAWPERKLPGRPERRADLDQLESVYRRLDALRWGQGAEGERQPITLPLTPDAADMFHEWEKANAVSGDDHGPLFQSFVGKMSGTAARLALVRELTLWACQGGSEPESVSRKSTAAAIDWIESYAKPMALRVYGDAAVPVCERNASLLARYIRSERFTSINMREMRQHPHRGKLKPLQAKGAMEDAFEVLVNCGWIAANFTRDGDNTGQHRKDYRINPAVHGAEL